MKNKVIIISFIACVLLLVFTICSKKQVQLDRISNNSLLQQLPHHIKLTWPTSPAKSQAISWRTRSSISKGYIQYVNATASPFFENDIKQIEAKTDTLTLEDGLWQYHRGNITGLKPATKYSYRVGYNDSWSEWAEFTTATGKNEPFSFIYFGDVQRYIYSLGSRIIRQAVLNEPKAKFMLFGGDLIQRGMLNKENWNEFFPAGGWAFQNIPTVATPGNHEHKWVEKQEREITPVWNLTFSFPENGPKGQEGKTYFLDYNNVRIISLDTSAKLSEEEKETTYNWVENTIKIYNGDWIIVTFHHAMAGVARNRDPQIRYPKLKAILEKYKVPLVLTGHEHVYARGRMKADFPIYVVSVAGGFQNAIQFSDWIERAATSMQLFQTIEVTSDSLTYSCKTVLGDVYDKFTIVKNKKGDMLFKEASNLPKQSLIPPKNFESRYDKAEVESYEQDKQSYLKRTKN